MPTDLVKPIAEDPVPAPVPASVADLAASLRRSLLRTSRVIRLQRVDASITLGQLTALSTLVRYGPMTPGELASHERLQPPTITKMLAALEEHDLVTRQPHPSDRRQAIITATPDGQAFVHREREQRTAWLVGKLAPLDEADRAVLRRAGEILDELTRD